MRLVSVSRMVPVVSVVCGLILAAPPSGGAARASEGLASGGLASEGLASGGEQKREDSSQLLYSTYLGGSWDDRVFSVAVAGGRIYVTGETGNADSLDNPFPTTPGAFDTTANGNAGTKDAFVAVFEPNGVGSADLLYCTFLGGTRDDVGNDIAVAGGKVYVTGRTSSSNFPVTPGAYDTGQDETGNAFIAVFDATLSTLEYATLLKAPPYASEEGICIAVADGKVFVAGITDSEYFPTTPGAFSTAMSGYEDVFLAVLDPAGNGTADLLYSTFLGGTQSGESLHQDCLAVSGGLVYLTGGTGDGFPTTPGAFDRTYTGVADVFVAIINPAGDGANDLVAATLLGASHQDYGHGIAVSQGKVYVTGSTTWMCNMTMEEQFPTTFGAWDRLLGDGYMPHDYDETDAFLSVFDGSLSTLLYSTFLGSEVTDRGRQVEVFGGLAYLAGYTWAQPGLSEPFPTTYGAYDTSPNSDGDFFLSVIDPAGNGFFDLVYSTYVGGGGMDFPHAMAVSGGVVYLAGDSPAYFPTTPGAFDVSENGYADGVVSVLFPSGLDEVFEDGFESGDCSAWASSVP